jgi:hypothetical protein
MVSTSSDIYFLILKLIQFIISKKYLYLKVSSEQPSLPADGKTIKTCFVLQQIFFNLI